MLLRSITKHVSDQNWFAVFIDFLIVVVGVFIGIQVANWNEARQERHQEREFLIRLHQDFEDSIAGQQRDIDFLDQQLADQSIILKSLDACKVTSNDTEPFQRGFNTLGGINAPRFYRRTVDEMTAAGETDIIQNEVLKARLSSIITLVTWREGFFQQATRRADYKRGIVEDYLRYDLSRTYPDSFVGAYVGVDFDISEMCSNPRLASAISSTSTITRERQNAYRPILEEYKAFLPIIEAELLKRWGIVPNEEVQQ